MEKLEKEFLENGGEWKTRELSEFFEIQNTLSFNKDRLVPGNEYDYVTRTSNNQGILESTGFINDENLNSSDIWSLGLLQMDFFYRRKPWYAGQFVKKIIPKIEMTPKVTMYFTVVLNKQKEKLLSVLVRDVDEVFNSACVDLPFLNGKINFSYMEKFIEELEAERIEELEAYLIATGLKNYKLTKEDQKILDDFEKMSDNSLDRQTDRVKIGELFEIRPTKSYKLTNIKLYTEKGIVPVITNTSYNNGIGGYSDLKPTENGNMITYSDTTTDSGIFYQPHDYIGYSHIQGLYPIKNREYSKNELFYILTCFRVSARGRFDYASKFNRAVASILPIELPFINNELDLEFMNRLIRVVEKLIIKDVVIWSDKKIEATKQVVLKH